MCLCGGVVAWQSSPIPEYLNSVCPTNSTRQPMSNSLSKFSTDLTGAQNKDQDNGDSEDGEGEGKDVDMNEENKDIDKVFGTTCLWFTKDGSISRLVTGWHLMSCHH